MKLNDNFGKLTDSYLFERLKAKKISAAKRGEELIDLGIGDIKLPVFERLSEAMRKAADELAEADTFKGYPPSTGYDFLKDAIIADYEKRGVKLSREEIFINNGAKDELFLFNSLIAKGSRILFPAPCYPAFVESTVLCGNKPIFVKPDKEMRNYPPISEKCDAIYLCSPQNPSGIVMTKKELRHWIDYALSVNATIVFDGAYSDFLSDSDVKSIFEIPNARKCAVEIKSFSKGYGFTGVRLGFSIIPTVQNELNSLKKRLCDCSSNGVSYVSQKGGLACFDDEIEKERIKRAKFYIDNAEILKIALGKIGIEYVGGNRSPYVFAKCPEGFTDESFCEFLIDKAGIIAAPGKSFYLGNAEYFRMAAFSPRKIILNAADRLKSLRF